MRRRQLVTRTALLAATIASWGAGAPAAAASGDGAAGRGKSQPGRPARGRRAKASAQAARSYAGHPAAASFAAELAQRRGWDRSWIEAQLARAYLVPTVQRLMMPPPAGTAKNWAAYRDRFVEPSRVQAGLRFWDEAADWLVRAEQRFGVPPEIVVGIVGVETFYGRILGDFRLIDALSTLSFDFPSGRSDRSDFFRGELEELLAWTQREKLDPAALRGSYAGAWGLPQFMPGSVNRYAVDFDGDGHVDLLNSAADVVGSVANYLATFGWQRGMFTHHAVAPPVDTSARATLLAPDIVPSFSADRMADLGAELSPAGQAHAGALALVELQNGDAAPSFVAGTQNFYVLTRYNRSSYYAMAVIALGEEVARARRRTPAQ